MIFDFTDIPNAVEELQQKVDTLEKLVALHQQEIWHLQNTLVGLHDRLDRLEKFFGEFFNPAPPRSISSKVNE